MSLPSDPKQRKNMPIARGVLDYFPDAIAAVAEVSRIGNDQHNPGQPLHWAKAKSTDHADCIVRHLIERGTADTDGSRHSVKLAWRALALLQTEIEAEEAAEEAKASIHPALINIDGEWRRPSGLPEGMSLLLKEWNAHMNDARADIHAAIRRLIAAIMQNTIDVTVQRRDVELLLAAVTSGRRQAGVAAPELHPEQR